MPLTPSVLDLYSGVGGISLGAARAGFAIAAAVDHNERVIQAHARNFPRSNHLVANLGEYSGPQLLRKLGIPKPTGIVGGPPCQGFSAMGRRDVVDPRNSLFHHFFTLVSQIKPKFFLAENVTGIADEIYSNLVAKALDQVTDDYWICPAFEVNASDYGAPTSRRRIIFYGQLKGCSLDLPNFSPRIRKRVTVGQALEGLPVAIDETWQRESEGWRNVTHYRTDSFSKRLQGMVPKGVGCQHSLARLRDESVVSGCLGTKHLPRVKKRFDALSQGATDSISRAIRLDINGLCPTLRAGTGPERGSYQAVRPIHPTEPRVITPREAARLQGFPDWFQFDSTKWHSFRMIGNSVSPILSEALLSSVKSIIENNEGYNHPGKGILRRGNHKGHFAG